MAEPGTLEEHRPPRDALRSAVGRRVAQLQSAWLTSDRARSASAAKHLAELRRAPVDALTGDFGCLLFTMEALPPEVQGRGDTVHPRERAAHAAFVLYAIHQQSTQAPVHAPGSGARRGRTVGHAAGEVARAAGDASDGVVRRFKAIASASSVDEALYHLGSFIPLLKGQERPVALDYGQLAVDILDLHSPAGRERVQLAWARDFHRVDAPATDASDSPLTTGDPS